MYTSNAARLNEPEATTFTRLADHPREPWGHFGDDRILVHSTLDRLRGLVFSKRARQAWALQYQEAKHRFNREASRNVVQNCISEDVYEDILYRVMQAEDDPVIVHPHPSFADPDHDGYEVQRRGPTNALPFDFADYLAARLGLEVDTEIVQAGRVGRTDMSREQRFIWQPIFTGRVRRGTPYILCDDVCTIGGTLAALRSYIVRNGGTILAVTTLAHGKGVHQTFAIAPQTATVLQSAYGPGLNGLWRGMIGHDTYCLTDAEGRVLVRWSAEGATDRSGSTPLQRLRDRLTQAATS